MRYIVFLFLAGVVFACQSRSLRDAGPGQKEGTTYIPEYEQRLGGDPEAGLDYLIYGDYVCSGLPLPMFKMASRTASENKLGREGKSADIPYQFNLFEVEGVEVVGGLTCFGCHASELNGELVLGLGNSFSDFTANLSPQVKMVHELIKRTYGESSPAFKAYEPLYRGSMAAAPYTVAPFRGVNPAFMIEKSVLAHRHPESLEWSDSAYYEMGHKTICSDVPPLWNVKKKHALYYTALGRGDFTKMLMQVMVVGMSDTVQAREIHTNFKDVLAWLYELEPPAYPEEIDKALASRGESIFNDNCSGCHGTYGNKETYPNLVIDLDKIKTDPLYARAFTDDYDDLEQWFNNSWFSQSDGKAWSASNRGYIAPPLDGIWATAPYLHNGSVPTIEQLLNSSSRPTYWRRTFKSDDYDYSRVGWNYEEVNSADDKETYDTTLPGYSNQGHYFGDKLTDEERSAVVEYLKTL